MLKITAVANCFHDISLYYGGYGEDGIPLKRYQVGPPAWTWQLPATQDYVIHAVSVGDRSPYTLQVSVEPLGPETAERVEFEPGAISAERSSLMGKADHTPSTNFTITFMIE